MLQSIHLLPPKPFLTPSYPLPKPPLSPLTFLHKSTSTHSLSSNLRTPWPIFATSMEEEGPIELSPDVPSIFATNDDPTPLQVSTSVLLTGAISIFLFRSVRRRAKRAKDLRMRSSGAKSMKEEALDSLKAIGSVSIESKTPSPVQAFLGAITAGVIAVILYKFTTTIEAALNRQTLSDSFSVRQITVTVRTIINGLCYLATFVFGLNSVGLFLYSGQLTLNSFSEGSGNSDVKNKDETESRSLNMSPENSSLEENNDTDQTS